MPECRTLSVSVERDWTEVYEALWRPECFPRWAAGLVRSSFREEAADWLAEGPEGPIRIRFTGHNDFGVMDHRVDAGAAGVIDVPMRVVRSGIGAEVMLTLFRQPGMTDTAFEADADAVQRDLLALKALVSS